MTLQPKQVELAMTGRVGVAILGTGPVAWRFAADMRHSTAAHVVAVGARRTDRASRLAASIGAHVATGTIEEVVRLASVDLVYVATSNDMHRLHALAAIEAGKAVLVEKPLALNGRDAAAIAQGAKDAGVFAMEAMWMRFTPGIRRLRAWTEEGRVGTPLRLQAGVSFRQTNARPAPGGALLDLGVYPVSLAVHLLGPVASVTAVGTRRDDDGTVVSADLFLRHGRATSSLSCGWNVEGANRATLQGADGLIETGGTMLCPASLTLRRWSEPVATTVVEDLRYRSGGSTFGRALRELLRPLRRPPSPTPYRGSGLQYQVDHVAECMRSGLLESPVMPLSESRQTLEIVEEGLRQIEEGPAVTG